MKSVPNQNLPTEYKIKVFGFFPNRIELLIIFQNNEISNLKEISSYEWIQFMEKSIKGF